MKILHNILKGLSLTAALFVFQACYGSPQVPPAIEDDSDEAVEATSPENAEGGETTIQISDAQ